jgi:hypothetical protein
MDLVMDIHTDTDTDRRRRQAVRLLLGGGGYLFLLGWELRVIRTYLIILLIFLMKNRMETRMEMRTGMGCRVRSRFRFLRGTSLSWEQSKVHHHLVTR